MELSNLPRDLVEEIVSKLSATSLRAIRLTCKKLNASFEEKHIISEEAKRESMVIILMDYKVYLMDINLHDLSIKRKAKLISLNGLDDHIVDISQIFPCDGLLLCHTKDRNKKLVVWNPYSAETRWIEPINPYHIFDNYAIGYEKKKNSSCRINKVLKYYDAGNTNFGCEIYELKTDSWRVLYITPPQWYLCQSSVSLKGNTYWIARNADHDFLFLICFDFTKERFGPRLSLPFQCHNEDSMALSSVREEQLVVLIKRWSKMKMEIWVTSKIQPQTVLWNNKLFLAVDIRPFIDLRFNFRRNSFFIDEEEKIAVVIDISKDFTRRIAYTVGENGYIKQVDLGALRNIACNSCISRNPKGNIMF